MNTCGKSLSNGPICEDEVVLVREDHNIALGKVPLPAGSKLEGKTFLYVFDCVPVISCGVFGMRISLFVQEELAIVTPDGVRFPLEFGFRFKTFTPLENCAAIPRLKDSIAELDCRIISITGTNRLKLQGNRTFDQCLRLTIKVEILRESTLEMVPCPPFSIACTDSDGEDGACE